MWLMLRDHMQIIRGRLGNGGFHRHGLERFHHANASAAANTLEDAELAIAHYLEHESSGEPGLDYLRTYGVLQAAYLQQDAAKLLRKAFGLRSELPRPMDELRELRNRATGHPVDEPEKKKPATFIVRYEMSSGRLKTLRIEAEGSSHSSSVDLRVMLKAHSEALSGFWMQELADELQRREKERREDIATRGQVAVLMPPWWSYALQKIHEVAGAPDELSARLAKADVSSLLNMLAAVEAGLRARHIDPPHTRAVETARAALDRVAGLLHRAAAGKQSSSILMPLQPSPNGT